MKGLKCWFQLDGQIWRLTVSHQTNCRSQHPVAHSSNIPWAIAKQNVVFPFHFGEEQEACHIYIKKIACLGSAFYAHEILWINLSLVGQQVGTDLRHLKVGGTDCLRHWRGTAAGTVKTWWDMSMWEMRAKCLRAKLCTFNREAEDSLNVVQ